MRAYSNLSDQAERLRSLLDLPGGGRSERAGRPARQPQNRLGPDEVALLVAAHEAGDGVKKLAGSFGVHRTTVHDILEREGALRPRGLSAESLSRAIGLYEAEGWSLARLAAEFGVSRNTVTNALRGAGVAIRRPGRRASDLPMGPG